MILPQFIPEPDTKALIFDCDGTLADTFPAHYRAFKAAFAIYNLNFEAAFYAERLGLSRYQLLAEFKALSGAKFDEEAVSRGNAELFMRNISAVKAIPFCENLVRHYHGKLPLGVASGGQRPIVTATLKAIDLYDLFDTVVTIEDVGKGKPEPDLYVKAAENLGIAPPLIQAFEDSDEGVEAARRAGMKIMDIRPHYQFDITTW